MACSQLKMSLKFIQSLFLNEGRTNSSRKEFVIPAESEATLQTF
jgi:hypothetical protein